MIVLRGQNIRYLIMISYITVRNISLPAAPVSKIGLGHLGDGLPNQSIDRESTRDAETNYTTKYTANNTKLNNHLKTTNRN